MPLEEFDTTMLHGKKQRNVSTRVYYYVRNIIFSDQTGQFPLVVAQQKKYIMIMVGIDSNTILVELSRRKDAELTRAYRVLIVPLKTAGSVTKKHVCNNEISEAMKTVIWDKYNIEMELVPPGCHRHNAADVAIRNFKAHFLSILAGVACDCPKSLCDCLLPQAEVITNLLQQLNSTPSVSAYTHLNSPVNYNMMSLAPMGCAA